MVMVPPRAVGALVTGSTTKLACGGSGSVSLARPEPVICLPARVAGRDVPTKRPVLPIASNESATAVGASEMPLTVLFTVAGSWAQGRSCIAYVTESNGVWPVDSPWNAASGLYEYEPFALIVTDAPEGRVWVSVAVPLSFVTVLVSPGSTSVSLASTPGAATLSGVSSSVAPESSTACGGALTAATVMPLVAESDSAVSSVTVKVTVRASVEGPSEVFT